MATLNLCSLNFIINYIRIINELKYENEVQIQAAQSVDKGGGLN